MFISFEGIEGAGKGTLLARLCTWFNACNLSYIVTKEPGGSELGASLRALLLDVRRNIVPEAELLLYLADRIQHVSELIRPALEQGLIVLSDRYADSTTVYQGYGRNLDLHLLNELNSFATKGCWPQFTFLIDLPVEMGLSRARQRNKEQGLTVYEGRFEAEALEFHQRIRTGYLHLAAHNRSRFIVLDGSLPAEQVFKKTQAELRLKAPALFGLEG